MQSKRGPDVDKIGRRHWRSGVASGIMVTAIFVAAPWARAWSAPPGQSATSVGSDQTSTDAGKDNAQAPGDILVTARRRSESLISVPDSVTAITSAQIAERRLQNISDFLAITPNVRLVREQDSANNSIYIRGIGGGNKGNASSVAVVIDGVILPDPDAYTVDLSDAQSVEVLKGPQGALYGKGAHAGVISITTRQPTEELKFDGKVSYGNRDTFNGFASVSGPIAGDKLLGLLSYKRQDTDGLMKNDSTGGNLDYVHSNKISGRLIAKPTDTLTFDASASYYDGKEGSPPYVAVDILGTGSTTVTSAQADTRIMHDRSDAGRRKITTAAFTASLDLGWADLKSISAYYRIRFQATQDLDFTALDVADVVSARFTRGISQELRITSRSDQPLRYIFGVYYQNTKHSNDQTASLDFCFLGVIPCSTPPLTVSGTQIPVHAADNMTTTNTYAAFGQINYDILHNLELTAALRFDRDEPQLEDGLAGRDASTHFSALQPKISIAYKPSKSLTIYATAARGYKPGVINQPTPNPRFLPIAKKEIADSEEIGVKGNLFDHRATATLALFHTRFKDAQIFQVDIENGGNQTANIDHVEIKGGEAQIEVRPARGFDVNAAFGYTKTDIRNFDGSSNYVGQSMPDQPRFTLNLGAKYKHDLGDNVSITPRIDFFRFGKTSFQDFQDPNPSEYLKQNPYNTVDTQVAFTRGAWTLTAFGKNIFDKNYVNAAFTRYLSTLIFVPLGKDVIAPAVGASYGVELRTSF